MQPNDLGIDYSTARPDPAAIVAAGYKFVIRYVSSTPILDGESKVLDIDERDRLWAAGLAIWLVWETSGTRALIGKAGGITDAHEARDLAGALGYPGNFPLFYTDDTDSTYDQVAPYYEGATSVDDFTGAYGGIHVVDPLLERGVVRFGFQSEAWSGTAVSQLAHLYQRVRPTRPLAGGGFDEDVLLKPLPLWLPPAPTPVALPELVVHANPGADGMYIYRVTDGPDVNEEIYNFGFGPVHINGQASADLVAGGVKVVPISGATYAQYLKGV